MLAIRLQRTGRKGYAQFRVVVQDARRSPSSGRVVANLGSYNPHSKAVVINKELAESYLTNGAQPSPRVVSLLASQGVKLPDWVNKTNNEKQKTTRNPEKLRKNQPEQPEAKDEVQSSEVTEAEPTTETQKEQEVATPPSDEVDKATDTTEDGLTEEASSAEANKETTSEVADSPENAEKK
jgi:small subunit ribosomal protein S16